MWQKALKIKGVGAGKEIWVKGKPETVANAVSLVNTERGPGVGYICNLYEADGYDLYIAAEAVELLARSPADFAEEVEVFNFYDWLDGKE